MQMMWKHQQLGGHVHVTVFTRTLPTETWANCGTLVFSEAEWPTVRAGLAKPGNWLVVAYPTADPEQAG